MRANFEGCKLLFDLARVQAKIPGVQEKKMQVTVGCLLVYVEFDQSQSRVKFEQKSCFKERYNCKAITRPLKIVRQFRAL